LHEASQQIEVQMRKYAEDFLRGEYGDQALKKLATYEFEAVYAYDSGGVSEVAGKVIRIAAKRDIDTGKLTETTKLTIRHELGHILDDESPDFPEFSELIAHERIAWANAKPKTPAEHWCKNLSIRTHIDPLKMQTLGFPCPERKISAEQLERGVNMELERMSKHCPFVDAHLAERYAMANLIENPDHYNSPSN
jgi:hypothetical protein